MLYIDLATLARIFASLSIQNAGDLNFWPRQETAATAKAKSRAKQSATINYQFNL